MQEGFDVGSGVACLSWKKSHFEEASLVVGTESGSVQVTILHHSNPSEVRHPLTFCAYSNRNIFQVWTFDTVARIWALDAELDSHERQVNTLCST